MMPVRDSFLAEDLANLFRCLHDGVAVLEEPFQKALTACVQALRQGNKILACGNGGSAGDAEHLVGEIVGRFGFDRDPLPAIALTAGSASFTAIANDYGFEKVFSRQVQGLGRKGDVLLCFSTSGSSPNVVAAAEAATALGMTSIAFTGSKESKLSRTAQITLRAPSQVTARIQEVHAVLIHSLCRGIEDQLFPNKTRPALPSHKLIESGDLPRFTASLAGHRSVFTNGCFDVLHPGHVALFKHCRSLGELLIVGLNTDSSIRRLKGADRPIHTFSDRAAVLAALSCVDYVVGFGEDTPLELIKTLTPTVLVKGGDYSRDTIVGADWVENHGGEVEVFPLVGKHSTTRILANGK
jgi:rfaE bifunctional protein nucleotidyltransferase chain/domain